MRRRTHCSPKSILFQANPRSETLRTRRVQSRPSGRPRRTRNGRTSRLITSTRASSSGTDESWEKRGDRPGSFILLRQVFKKKLFFLLPGPIDIVEHVIQGSREGCAGWNNQHNIQHPRGLPGRELTTLCHKSDALTTRPWLLANILYLKSQRVAIFFNVICPPKKVVEGLIYATLQWNCLQARKIFGYTIGYSIGI